LFSGFRIAANFSRADPGAKGRKVCFFQKQLPSSKSKPFPKESDRSLTLIKEQLFHKFPKALGHESV
jgi:hypothetical protein